MDQLRLNEDYTVKNDRNKPAVLYEARFTPHEMGKKKFSAS